MRIETSAENINIRIIDEKGDVVFRVATPKYSVTAQLDKLAEGVMALINKVGESEHANHVREIARIAECAAARAKGAAPSTKSEGFDFDSDLDFTTREDA